MTSINHQNLDLGKQHTPQARLNTRLLRVEAGSLAKRIEELCPANRERDRALANLTQVTMWAEASLYAEE